MIYDAKIGSVVIDAEELSALATKSGSIDARFPAHVSEYLSLSSEAFEKIYKKELAYLTRDVCLEFSREYGDVRFEVSAVADAVVINGGEMSLDLVRGVRKYDFYAPLKNDLIAYLSCCAAAIFESQKIDTLRARIYYVYGDTGAKIKSFDFSFERDELKDYIDGLFAKIMPRAKNEIERKLSALPSAAECVFPYPALREGQEIMIRECYSAIKQSKRIFLSAPTGTGKTAAALYPSIRALGNGLVSKIFYLTSKASTRREAFAGASKLFSAGAKLRTITIGAKEQVCLCGARKLLGVGGQLCNPVDCPYARGYYDKVEGAIGELLSVSHGYTIKQIAEVAKRYEVCPYELSLGLSELCDIIICDYNYVFDPSVYFRRYFAEGRADREKYVFLVDEAHNLADRARDMYSATLDNTAFEKIYSKIDARDTELNDMFEAIILNFRGLKKLCRDSLTKGSDGIERGFYVSNSELTSFSESLLKFKKKCEKYLRDHSDHELWQPINHLISDVRKYLCVSEFFDSRFYNYVFVEGEKRSIKIFCLDPSYILDKIESRAVSTVMFSATLVPKDYFSEILGGGRDAIKIALPSPFDPARLCVAVAGHISMRLEDRRTSYAKYVSVIAATVSRRHGNYIAYFPSYECLEGVYSAFVKKYPAVSTIVQKRGMTFSQKEEFLNYFKNDSGVLRVGFCVLGGSFSEGVDLPGGRLIGTIIFGVGLPGLSTEKNIIRDYYENRAEVGYDYAYTYPGMNNVLQAAGRVIRTDADMGVVVLADDRYTEEKYKELFPEHWNDVKYANNASELAGIIQNFWKNGDFYV